jgi:hypothetical protein
MQPSLPDPTNPIGQPSSQSEPPLSSPQGSYPLGEEAYYNNQVSQDGGPITRYQAGNQGKLYVPPVPLKPRNGWKVVSLVLFILVLILASATTTLILTRPSSSPGPQIGGVATPTSIATRPIATPTSVATQTPQPTVTAALVISGTITENLLLTCGANCNDPIHVTITTIQVDDANGNMIWNISLKNVSGSSGGYIINTFELLASGTQTQIPATFPQSNGSLPNSDPVSIQGTFSFVPIQNTVYTLTVTIQEFFGGSQIPFDPVQITNL